MKRKPTDAEVARAAEIAALSWDKYVRVADEDDDRRHPVTREEVNPRRAKAAERLAARGLRAGHWAPPIEHDGFGYFHAMLRLDGRRADGTLLWRISCWGGDNTAYERTGMTRETAERVWSQLRDFITIRSLFGRLGFGNW